MANDMVHNTIPHWNPARRELTLGGMVIKRFRQRAGNQERVLMAFEEEGWPQKVLDPLPPNGETHPKRRLQDTVYHLNRHHINKGLIRFEMDGTGEAVLWREMVKAS